MTHSPTWATAYQRTPHEHFWLPLFNAVIDDCYARGILPLPPLCPSLISDGWTRGEPWYLGDLT